MKNEITARDLDYTTEWDEEGITCWVRVSLIKNDKLVDCFRINTECGGSLSDIDLQHIAWSYNLEKRMKKRGGLV